ncbi:alpha/beta fold hydrolase [Dermatobacter hominis]|uniref:alpha/beta fold hydrolase n=1 Tax=Dermatobacter hominis TaxID=2884263 RepID=UPI001D10FC23|nr:alpha/beta fold hydrolase [Dermatobacter hominis]UDY36403.1 alpha/beta hydrolase [Dermatobacter hominis]
MTTWMHPEIGDWEARGRRVAASGPTLGDVDVFVVDAPARTSEELEPLVVVHGFPTSSFDFAHLVDQLSDRRRVVLVDLPGFGLSDKPDAPYRVAGSADAVASVCDQLGLRRFALLSHDMGDTVVGELLARQLDGDWDVDVTRRVVTNGSIYIEMAHLTDGQLMLLSMPDERAARGPGPELLAASLVATLAPAHADVDMSAHAELQCHLGGDRLLPRIIRYIEERRADEARFTGAIEAHPSDLHVVWGPEDPIAVAAMADRLVAARPDATLTWIEGAGHYPQLEEPRSYLEALRAAIG